MRTISLLMAGVFAVSTMIGASVAFAEEVTVKLWARADRSGPLRAGNIVAAAEPLNAALKAVDPRLGGLPIGTHLGVGTPDAKMLAVIPDRVLAVQIRIGGPQGDTADRPAP